MAAPHDPMKHGRPVTNRGAEDLRTPELQRQVNRMQRLLDEQRKRKRGETFMRSTTILNGKGGGGGW